MASLVKSDRSSLRATSVSRSLALAALAGTCFATLAPNASAQAADGGIVRQEDERFTLLDDFMHFVLIDRPDIADAKGRELLALGVTPSEFLRLVEDVERQRRGRNFLDVAARALRRPDLEATAGSLLALFEQGRLELARDPQEIARNIELLSGNIRQRTYGRERLIAAGEYAMPQLLEAMLQTQDVRRRTAAREVIVSLERQAVVPLAEALLGLAPGDQEQVADVLAQIPYTASVPALISVTEDTQSPGVRDATSAAVAQFDATDASAGDAWATLAARYYIEPEELTSFEGERHQLLWTYDPTIGLVATPIATEVYHEAMVMRLIERALDRGSVSTDALALWVAANFSREIDQPAGYVNPAYGVDRRDAEYFAVASGSEVGELVLRAALDAQDTPLALRVLRAIGRTAGPDQITTGSALVDAMNYPDRRVRYEAALVVAGAGPRSDFFGSDRVVPVLSSAIRFAGQRYAVVLAPENESYQSAKTALEAAGYTVLPRGTRIADIAEPIAETPGIDLLVAVAPSGIQPDLLSEVRADPRLVATPYLGLVESAEAFAMRTRFDADTSVSFRDEGVTGSALRAATTELIDAAAGGTLTPDESDNYASRAIATLRDLAVSGNTITPASKATLPLVATLEESTGALRESIAEVLGLLDAPTAQRALVEGALRASGDDRVMLLEAAAASGRRFGNNLEDRQAEALVALAIEGGPDEATAAAAVIGALNLPGADLAKLVANN